MDHWQKKGYDIVNCKSCFEFNYRKAVGISPNRRRKYYQDENGGAWKGRVCPACSTKAHTEYMRAYRKTSKAQEI